MAIDVEGMIHAARVESAPPWTGAPLHFTTDYYSPADLDAAWEHWQFLHRGTLGGHVLSRMWHRAITGPAGCEVGQHGLDLLNADLRCLGDQHRHASCSCVGDLLYLIVCEPCEWHTITSNENRAVESWHDHAIDGWRELPVVPARIRVVDDKGLTARGRAWIEEHYPEHMQFSGAPIITERKPMGTRHVPGRSPWGGYDLSHTAVDAHHQVRRVWTPERRQEAARSVESDLSL